MVLGRDSEGAEGQASQNTDAPVLHGVGWTDLDRKRRAQAYGTLRPGDVAEQRMPRAGSDTAAGLEYGASGILGGRRPLYDRVLRLRWHRWESGKADEGQPGDCFVSTRLY